MNFKIAAHTDIGIRKKTNQDSVLIKVARTDQGRVCLASVCDGMGGLAKGELASATLIRRLNRWFEDELPLMLEKGIDKPELEKNWTDLIYETSRAIAAFGRSIHVDMGTTMVLLLIVGHDYYIVNVGDSRIYMIRDELTRITKDQTFIQREMEEGRMTWEEAQVDPRRNVLLQCIGASEVIEPAFHYGTILPGTNFLLCSDGFRHVLSDEELYEYLSPFRLFNKQQMAENLKYLIDLAKYRKEVDNISAAIIRCD